jgi:hypothetical protein
MGTLRDEAYEKLDYLSQLTEVIVNPYDEVLAKVPERLELDFEQLNAARVASWKHDATYEITTYAVVVNFLWKALYKRDEKIISILHQNGYFQFEMSSDFELDFIKQEMHGSIALIKTKSHLDEKSILKFAVNDAVSRLSSYKWPKKTLREKAITILNILQPNSGIEWAEKVKGNRSSGEARNEIEHLLEENILTNKWRIRNTKLIENIGEWINSYLSNTSETGILNLFKLKIMIEKDFPIYSIDEVKNVSK